MKLLSVLFFALFFLLPAHCFAESNTGFVQGIWYSQSPVFDGVPTRIYVAVRNNTAHDLTGTVRFSDNGKRIGSSEISALSGRLVEAWVDWNPLYGSHTISAQISDATLHIIGGKTEQIDITGIVVDDTISVDYDTDGDGIGNTEDADDDNDGISDEDEYARGSNPFVTNPVVIESVADSNSSSEKQKIQENSPLRPSTTISQGLEQYVTDGSAHTFLSSATEKIEQIKKTVDVYREERSTASPQGGEAVEPASEKTDISTSPSSNNATITRTQINPEKGFFTQFVAGIGSLLSALWTLSLYIISEILAHPAFVELVLLILILYGIYRTAKRLGQRNKK